MEQDIRFCTTSDGVRIAYATLGQGPDLVKAANWLTHLELDLKTSVWAHWLIGLSRTHRLIRYDERGCGLSDWEVEDFSFDAWVRDLEAVVDEVCSDRFALLGISQGGPVAIAYAVRHPERVSHLILYGAYARGWARRGSHGQEEERNALMTLTRQGWGRNSPAYRQVFTSILMPDAREEEFQSFNEIQRLSTSPDNAVRFQEVFGDIEVSHLLSQVRVPTLVIHPRDDQAVPFDEGRRLAAAIPDSRLVPLDGRNHLMRAEEPAWPAFLAEVRAFLGVDPTELAAVLARDAQEVEARSDERSFVQRLRDRQIVQWGLAYLAGAWLFLQLLDLLEGPWHLSDRLLRNVQALLALGLPLTLAAAWYHGGLARQRSGRIVVAIIALLLVVTAVTVALVGPG